MKILAITLFLLLAGCASNPYGNYTDKEATHATVLDDVLMQLNALHPPAQTTFSLIHEVKPKDIFGNSLISEMRTQGYAVQDFSKEVEPTGISFGYTLDQIDNVYRVTIYVNDQRLSRPYLIESGSVVPSGAWSRKE